MPLSGVVYAVHKEFGQGTLEEAKAQYFFFSFSFSFFFFPGGSTEAAVELMRTIPCSRKDGNDVSSFT